jgi:hypothetical protein
LLRPTGQARGLKAHGHADYVINAEALAYMRGRSLAGWVIRLLAEHDDKRFAGNGAPAGRHGWRICVGSASPDST